MEMEMEMDRRYIDITSPIEATTEKFKSDYPGIMVKVGSANGSDVFSKTASAYYPSDVFDNDGIAPFLLVNDIPTLSKALEERSIVITTWTLKRERK